MKVFCRVHEKGFFAPRQNPIKCDNRSHILGELNFAGDKRQPAELHWQYCCNCEHFCPISENGESLAVCPVCARRTSQMYVCDRCFTISFESNTPVDSKNFTLTADGVTRPACPGCLQTSSGEVREHACDDLGTSFTTARAENRRLQIVEPRVDARLDVMVTVGLAAVAGGLSGAILLQGNGNSGTGAAPPRPTGPVQFTTAAAYDPFGDGQEHDEAAQDAIDGNVATPWMTEHYRSFTKQGVGLVVGANRAVSPKTMTIITDTPGFTAQIKAGDSATGPFHTVSNSRTIASTTATFSLNGGGRYFLVWITNLGSNDQVRIDEVKAR